MIGMVQRTTCHARLRITAAASTAQTTITDAQTNEATSTGPALPISAIMTARGILTNASTTLPLPL